MWNRLELRVNLRNIVNGVLFSLPTFPTCTRMMYSYKVIPITHIENKIDLTKMHRPVIYKTYVFEVPNPNLIN